MCDIICSKCMLQISITELQIYEYNDWMWKRRAIEEGWFHVTAVTMWNRAQGCISQCFLSHWTAYGEMPSKLWLIVANFQIHWATLPPKGSVFIAQSGRLRCISSDKKQLYALLKIKEKKHILNQTHHINRRLNNKLTKPSTFILL